MLKAGLQEDCIASSQALEQADGERIYMLLLLLLLLILLILLK
jgi:hypothetical protein